MSEIVEDCGRMSDTFEIVKECRRQLRIFQPDTVSDNFFCLRLSHELEFVSLPQVCLRALRSPNSIWGAPQFWGMTARMREM